MNCLERGGGGGGRGYGGKKSDSVQNLQELSKCNVMLQEGRIRRRRKEEEEENQREKGRVMEQMSEGSREGIKEETGREGERGTLIDSPMSKSTEGDRGWLEKRVKSSQYHKVFPKLPVERKGVWPRLVRQNGVTPGRQCTC